MLILVFLFFLLLLLHFLLLLLLFLLFFLLYVWHLYFLFLLLFLFFLLFLLLLLLFLYFLLYFFWRLSLINFQISKHWKIQNLIQKCRRVRQSFLNYIHVSIINNVDIFKLVLFQQIFNMFYVLLIIIMEYYYILLSRMVYLLFQKCYQLFIKFLAVC